MAVTETDRYELYLALVERMGKKLADTLMELLIQGYTARLRITDVDELRRRVDRLERELQLVRG